MLRKLIIALIVLNIGYVLSTPACAAKPYKVEFATYLDWGAETDAQFVFFLSTLFDYMGKEMGVKHSHYKHYTSKKEFYDKFINGSGARFTIVGNRAEMVTLIRDHGFKPILAYDIVGLTRNQACLYVPESSSIKSIKDLQGKRLGAHQGPFAFCLVDGLVDARPNWYFSDYLETGTGLEAVYMLSLKNADAVFVTHQIVEFLKRNNPGAVKGLKELECGPPYMFLPLLAKDAPAEIEDMILPLLKKVEKGKALKEHQGVIRLQQLKFKSVTIEDFRWDIAFYTRAEEHACVDDYYSWLESKEDGD